MNIRDIQTALAARGYRPGALDGIWGRQTAAAVRAFQAASGLEPDGIVGPLTLAALLGTEDASKGGGLNNPSLVWFQEARRLLGTWEHPGTGNNPDILDWAEDLDVGYPNDDVPWCGLFVGHCIGATLDREPLPGALLRARSWESFGIKTDPTPGAVLVFWRGSKSGWQGHVGFYAGENKAKKAYRVLGGNQSNSVSLAWIAEDRLLGARWPSTVAPARPTAVEIADLKEELSWNEA